MNGLLPKLPMLMDTPLAATFPKVKKLKDHHQAVGKIYLKVPHMFRKTYFHLQALLIILLYIRAEREKTILSYL